MSPQHRNLVGIAIALVTALTANTTFAGQTTTVKRIELLSGLQVLLEYGLSAEEILIKHCTSSNPDTPKLMERHREPIARTLPRVQTLLVKYKSRLLNELGEAEARRINLSYEEKQADLRQEFEKSNQRDVAQRKFDCQRDPATLAGVPEEIEQALDRMERE